MASPEVKLKLTNEFAERAWEGWCKKTGQRLDRKKFVDVEHVKAAGARSGSAPVPQTYCFVAVNLTTFEARLAKLTD